MKSFTIVIKHQKNKKKRKSGEGQALSLGPNDIKTLNKKNEELLEVFRKRLANATQVRYLFH